jgi:hypothetical protein
MFGANRTALRSARNRILTFGFFLMAITSQFNLRAQDSGAGLPVLAKRVYPRALSGSTRRVVFNRRAFLSQSAAVPRWDNGYLVSREVETYQSGLPNVRLYDNSGEMAREAVIWFPGSQRVVIYSATVTSDGRIVASGDAQKTDGTAAPFIVLTDLAGKVTSVIQTIGFAPANICQAPDGTVWSLGGTGYNDHSEPNPGNTLRRFDFQKGEIGSYLSRSTFPRRPGPESLAHIRCSTNEVVAYSSRAQVYIEMKYGAPAPHIYHAEEPSGLRLVGFAMTGSKEIYGYFSRAGKSGLYFLSFDEGASTVAWLPIGGTVGLYTKSGVITGLWGSDGDKLVVSRAEDGAGETALHWATPLNQ